MSTIEPNSPTALPNESAAPESIAGSRFGRMIRRKVVNGRAPSDAAASSIAVELLEHRGPDDEGERDEEERHDDRRSRIGDVDAEEAPRPVDGEASARPRSSARERQVDDRVDDALARKVVADEPRAIKVPVTAFTATTIREATNVSLSAATAAGEVT